MEKIKIENITIDLYSKDDNIMIKSEAQNILLINQNIETVSYLIRTNFDVVYKYYKSKVIDQSNLENVSKISILIVLQYLYIYNSWRNTYKNKATQDLQFNEQDFVNPMTSDIIMNFYRETDPINWDVKSSILLEMTLEELRSYYKERELFYNK